MKISHEPFRAKSLAGQRADWQEEFKTAVADDKNLGLHLNKAVEDMNPLKVLELFKRISAEVGD